MAGYRASARELNSMAAEAMTPPAPPPLAGGDQLSRHDTDLARRYGLTSQEVSIANRTLRKQIGGKLQEINTREC
jgi:hypothetical protein